MKSDPPNSRRGLAGWAVGAVLTALIAAGGAPARAEPPVLDLPIDCRIGETCWLVNLVDRDPGPGRADFRCGPLSYDGHKGTDIAIASTAEMRRGVAVLAAAPGRVRATRDGMPANEGAGYPPGQDCGNGVVIDHADGWSTQYCHLKAGSVAVGRGQSVERGQRLGDVGLSGRTEFPHMHVTVRDGDTVIDPFTGDTQIGVCRKDAPVRGLWSATARTALVYPGPQPYLAGFAAGVPKIDRVRAGQAGESRFAADAPAILFWVDLFTLAAGDRIELQMLAPGGQVIVAHALTQEKDQARRFVYAGHRQPAGGWPAGTYTGVVTIERGGQVAAERRLDAVVE